MLTPQPATPDSTALLTDKYELTMIDAALASGVAQRRAIFELFGRNLPHSRRFGVVAGTGRLLEGLRRFRFDQTQLEWLEGQRFLRPATLDYLADFKFSGNISGYAEGELYFAGSPILTVEGTFAEATILETLFLSIFNHDCAVAAAGSRMTIAAHGRPCVDMGARRTHERAAVSAARAAFIAGFTASSDLESGIRYGLDTVGTSAHSFTLLYDSEEDAFAAQIAALGPGTTLLVDTYDIEQGVNNAVQAARDAGGELGAVRLDSGDLVAHAVRVRNQLDELGATSTKITVTSDLDEYSIAALGAAPVDTYGVGTRLVTGSGVPAAALVYKLVEREDAAGNMVPMAKKSESKGTVGGRKVAGRLHDARGRAAQEALVMGAPVQEARERLEEAGARLLQVPLVEGGVILEESWKPEGAVAAQKRHHDSRNELPYQGWRLADGDPAIPTRYYGTGDPIRL